MIRRPPRSTLFPTRRSSDLAYDLERDLGVRLDWLPYVLDIPSFLGSGCRAHRDRKSTRLNSSHTVISYAVFCLKKKKNKKNTKHEKETMSRAPKQAPL